MDESTKMREEILNRLEHINSEAENNINNELNKEDKVMMETRLVVRDAAIKSWTMNLIEEQHLEWTRLFDQKIGEQANTLKNTMPGGATTVAVKDK